jgi:hypothetical protein
MRDGTSRPTTGEDWITDVVAINVGDQVPEDVATLFDFAKGALGYGYYYYPLFTLATQQLLRVADIAVDELFKALAIERKPLSLVRRLAILYERRLISDEQYRMLDILRNMRNSATHGSSPTIMIPTQAVRDMRWIADLISGLPWPKGITPADSGT